MQVQMGNKQMTAEEINLLLCPKGTVLCILWKGEKLSMKCVLKSQS